MGLPIIGELIDLVKGVTDKVIVDKNKKLDILSKLDDLKDKTDERFHDELMGQIEVNKVEATNTNVFVAGWRPAVGWICAFGLGWQFVLSPFVEVISRWLGWTGQMPVVDASTLLTLVLGMLGIGAQRTFEKVKGVASNELKT